MQIIFHIDLNAFFASAEVSINPSLEGKPLVISGNGRRSIVSTASYEARAFGIHSAMPLYQAKQLCKNLIVRPANFELYRDLSNKFFELISHYSPYIEVASIDECYVDFTEYFQSHNIHPQYLASIIQEDVYNQLKLKCSIGIAPNKFMAKMASDIKKPMGITIINRKNYKEVLWPLDVSDMFGVGKKTAPKLKEIGINTIGDVASSKNLDKIRQVLGQHALILYRKANGVDNSKVVVEKRLSKSIGNSSTLEYDTYDEEVLRELLKKLSKSVSDRAISKNMYSNSISITMKYSRFETVTRQTIIDRYVNDYETIISTAQYLFDQHYDGRSIRLLGVALNNTLPASKVNIQLSLFDYNKNEEKLVTKLKKKHNIDIIVASDLLKKNDK